MRDYTWYPRVTLTLGQAQELHEIIGAAIECGDLSHLPRAREIAALLVSDLTSEYTSGGEET